MILSPDIFCLLKLSTTPQLCPPLLLSYTFDVLNLIHEHNQPNTIRYLLCIIYYALYTALCTIYYALCTMHYALFTMHYALCIIYYALTMHYSLCTMHYALFTMHYTLFTMYLSVFIRIYYFIHIHMYLLFHMEIRQNPVILVLARRVTIPTGPKSADH